VTDIDKMVEDYHTFIKEAQTKMQDKMKDLFKEFFVQNPKIKFIMWEGYTPGFCDGDPCYFIQYFGYLNFLCVVMDAEAWHKYHGHRRELIVPLDEPGTRRSLWSESMLILG